MGHHWLTLVFAMGWVLLPRVASVQAAETRTPGDQSSNLVGRVERLLRRTHAFH